MQETYPTIARSSDCLLSASLLIFVSTRFTSRTCSRLNTSSGSISAQSSLLSVLLPFASFSLRIRLDPLALPNAVPVEVPVTLGAMLGVYKPLLDTCPEKSGTGGGGMEYDGMWLERKDDDGD